MGASLIQSLQEMRDFRAEIGRRYPLWLILLWRDHGHPEWMPLVIMRSKTLGCVTNTTPK